MTTQTTPPKFPLESMDVAEEKRRQLKQLFPEAFTEARDGRSGELKHAVDWEKLKASLGEVLEREGERFGLTWPGKSGLLKIIQQPSVGTLKPCRGESEKFDETENLFIEGDNLEVLKLLQKSYFGKVKMIYIDPPYNTGNEFVYPDNFTETLETYLQYTGMVDVEGRKFSTNTATEGRFHSKWLNMMYPRLFLARNLLRENGVIFINIGNDELGNLITLCHELFGEENCCGYFVWEKKKKPSFLSHNMGTTTDYILAYAKNRSSSPVFSAGSVEDGKKYPFNNAGNGIQTLTFPRGSVCFRCPDQIVPPQDMSEGNIVTELLDRVIIKNGKNENAFRLSGEWRYSQKTLDDFVRDKAEIFISKIPFRPNYINKSGEPKKTANLLSHRFNNIPTNEDATAEIEQLLSSSIMDYPKPSGLMAYLARAVTNNDEIIVDFFSGSCSTAHAVLDLNKEDGGNRKFIMVQLPEPCDEKSEAAKAGYQTIADIGKERIRRVIRKIEQEQEGQLALGAGAKKQDLGFKVFKLAESNFALWDGQEKDPEKLKKQLELHINHIDPNASAEDILYELLLKAGFPLTTEVAQIDVAGKTAYSVADGALIICLDDNLTKEAIKAIAELKPVQSICLDAAFHGNDQLKTNAVQAMEAAKVQFRTV